MVTYSRAAVLCLLFGCGSAGLMLVQCGSHGGGGNSDGRQPDGGIDGTSDATSDANPDAAQTADATGDAPDTGTSPDGGDGGDATSDGQAPADGGGGSDAADADAGSDAGDGGALSDASCDGCAAPLACCSGACVDLTRDPHNCGQCGNLCTLTQFCTGKKCDDAVLANLCDNSRATVVTDSFGGDNEAGAALGHALATSCAPAVAVTDVSSADAGGVLADSGQPILGPGNTLVTGGGAFGQPSVAYMDQSGFTSLYLATDGTTAWFKNRATGTAVVSAPVTSLTAHHDYFFLEVSVEPATGTLCFSGLGMLNPGTLAAGYYGSAQILPNRATFTHAWYAYEWTDANSDSVPNAGDTFTLISAGP